MLHWRFSCAFVFRFVTFLCVGGLLTRKFPASHALPLGFIAETVSHDSAVSGVFAPNPRGNSSMLLLASKDEGVRVLENPDESRESMVVLDLANREFLCVNGERGLQAITVHPKFNVQEGNYWIYLFYTEFKQLCMLGREHVDKSVGPRNIVARFRMDPDTLMIDEGSKEEIWASTPGYGQNHNGGAMAFGADGKLWITMGDNNDVESVQDLKNTLGTIIRVNPEDGSVPHDNPFSQKNGYKSYLCSQFGGRVPPHAPADAVCGEIFAYGFRNPFRISMDPTVTDKVMFTIQDVGQDTWEEISDGGTNYAGRNYGWPTAEGVCEQGSVSNCTMPQNPNAVEPFHWYMHRDRNISTGFQGGCVTAGVFVPEGIWPSNYKYLFADFTFKEVYLLLKRRQRECRNCVPPLPGTKNSTFYRSPKTNQDFTDLNAGRMTDLFFGPFGEAQALYLVQGGDDTVIRIRYTGSLKSPPVADFLVPKQNLEVGEVIQFEKRSTDEDRGTLTFEWNFGDGSISNEKSPLHIYEAPGQYRVTLTVIDEVDQTQQRSRTVIVGELPNATIVSPALGDEFEVGQKMILQGYALDSLGNNISDSQIEWEVQQHHADHYHPFMSRTNCTGFVLDPAPGPEDFFAASNSFLRVIMYATDSYGLTAEVYRDVQPKIVMIEVDSFPSGMVITVHGSKITTPLTFASWANLDLPLEVNDQPPFIFSHWNNTNGDKITTKRRIFKVPTSYSNRPLINAVFCIGSAFEHNCTELQVECCSGTCVNDKCGLPGKS